MNIFGVVHVLPYFHSFRWQLGSRVCGRSAASKPEILGSMDTVVVVAALNISPFKVAFLCVSSRRESLLTAC